MTEKEFEKRLATLETLVVPASVDILLMQEMLAVMVRMISETVPSFDIEHLRQTAYGRLVSMEEKGMSVMAVAQARAIIDRMMPSPEFQP